MHVLNVVTHAVLNRQTKKSQGLFEKEMLKQFTTFKKRTEGENNEEKRFCNKQWETKNDLNKVTETLNKFVFDTKLTST